MNQPQTSAKPNILVAPLDWGLGHATRCIPVISELLRQNCRVFIAANGRGKRLLEQEFSDLTYINLQGYDVGYSSSRWTLPFVILSQIPKILSRIKYENERLKNIVKIHNIHAVISDNRYGLYHSSIPTVFLTHQLLIKTPFGRPAEKLLQKLNYKYISRFSECWVPDLEHEPSYAGKLSHPEHQPGIPLKYIGPLSRFTPESSALPYKHLLILLSGPEPQRSIFEEMIISQLHQVQQPVVLVRGLPDEADKPRLPASVQVFNHLPASALRQKIREASFLISRCGYSTIMDLTVLRKRSILVPTPGQTEQEYLATQMMKSNFALCIPQEKFGLKAALSLANEFPYQLNRHLNDSHLVSAIKSLLYKMEFSVFDHY